MDLDVGCKRDFAPLLRGDWDVVLMKTIPVSLTSREGGTGTESSRARRLDLKPADRALTLPTALLASTTILRSECRTT